MMARYVLYTGWDGCGTTAAYAFFNRVGKNLGWSGKQWPHSPIVPVSLAMRNNESLDVIWDNIIKPTVLTSPSRGYSGFPYSLFYRQWDADTDFDVIFVHAFKKVENWAYDELGYHYCRTIPMSEYYDHIDYIYGVEIDENSSIADWQTWIDRYKKHNTEVVEYFGDKPDRYRYVNLDDAVNKDVCLMICEFMGIDYEETYSFPISPSENVADWNLAHIRNLQEELSYEDLWDSRKSSLIL
jgi:hypothetical protein